MRLPAFLLSLALGAMMFATSSVASADERPSSTTPTSGSVVREPQPQRVRRSQGAFATGLVLAITGGVGVGVGAGLYISGSNHSCWNAPLCDPAEQAKRPDDDGLKNGGIAILAMSAVMIAVGVPMAIIGGKKITIENAATASSPLAFRF